MDVAAELQRHRGYLLGVAYRMTGSIADAEDIVQEAYLRAARTPPAGIGEPRAWLTTVVTRLSVDHLRSARVRRETYIGPWLPEPLVEAGPDPGEQVELAESVSLALLRVLESLSPAERAVFVLHEAFGVRLEEVAGMVGRSPQACRQLASRARRHVRERAPRFDADQDEQRRVVGAFVGACTSGDLEALVVLLDPTAVLRADGGGVVQAARRTIVGADKVARLMIGIVRAEHGGNAIPVRVGGSPGLLLRRADGSLGGVMGFAVADGRITEIDWVLNPAKLAHLDGHLAKPL